LERQLEQANDRDRENRRLLAAALERIPPQLEAPQTSEDAPGQPAEPSEGVEPHPEESTPWWRRILR
jgi:hypothetical protein